MMLLIEAETIARSHLPIPGVNANANFLTTAAQRRKSTSFPSSVLASQGRGGKDACLDSGCAAAADRSNP